MPLTEYQISRAKYIQAGRPLRDKKKYYLPKVSKKRAKQLKEQKQNGSDSEMDLFFTAMRKKCNGRCLFCNGSTTVKNDELWRIAIAHLLPKSNFKSVAVNENNWVELCWDCHTKFDSGMISWQLLFDSKERLILKEKLLEILPLVAEEERKNKLYSKLINLVYEQNK